MVLEVLSSETGNCDDVFSIDNILVTLRENIESKGYTLDQLKTLEMSLSKDAVKFNKCLTTISNAITEAKSGGITNEEAKRICAPCIADLREKCISLGVISSDTDINSDDINECDIATLREVIVRCKDVVIDMKYQKQETCCESTSLDSIVWDVADEAFGDANYLKEIRNSTKSKTASEYYQQARKLFTIGDKTKAYDYLSKAKGLFKECKEDVEARVKKYDEQRSVSTTVGKSTYTSKSTKSVTDSRLAGAMDYFDSKIEACDALEMQWKNKAGSNDLKETKAKLKDEREVERRKHGRTSLVDRIKTSI